MEVIEPQTSEHDLRVLREKMVQMEFFYSGLVNEVKKQKSETHRLQSEIDILKAEIREIKAKRGN
jgi:polyhydroxyalkanoate synthesis regulator phasin